MKRFFLFILIIFHLIAFGQHSIPEQSLEQKTYEKLDQFLKKPTPENLKTLAVFEKQLYDLPKTPSENVAYVILLCNKAYYENQFGNSIQAISSYEKAWQHYQKNKLKNYDITEYCLKPLGNLYTIIGDYERAENTVKQYLYLADVEKNKAQKNAAILNLSAIYQSSGRTELAVTLVQQTLTSKHLTAVQKGLLQNNLGAAYLLQNDLNNALAALQKSIVLLQNQKTQPLELSNAYRNLAAVYSQKKDFKNATIAFAKAKKLFATRSKQEPRKWAKLYYDEALLLFQQTKTEAAAEKIATVFKTLIVGFNSNAILPTEQQLYAESTLEAALDLQASIFVAENLPEEALKSYKYAAHVAQLLQVLCTSENAKLIAQSSIRERTEKCLEIDAALYQKTKESRWIEEAFLLSEASKSNVLKDYLSRSSTFSTAEKKLYDQLVQTNLEIRKEQQKGDSASVSIIDKWIRKQNDLMLLLKSTPKTELISRENLTIKKVTEKLKVDNTVLLSYFYGEKKVYWFYVENEKISLHSFPNSILNKAKITHFLSFFSNANAINDDILGYKKSAFEMYTLFLFPKKNGSKSLVIFPDGLLNFVPFESILTQQSNGSDFSTFPYLMHRYQISYQNSVALYLNGKPFRFKTERILGLFPVFENSASELRFSKKELAAIRENFSGKCLEKEQATYANFKKYAADYSILHLSTHASAGDLYDPAYLKFRDKDVYYSELYQLNSQPDLVVLSACETGIGKLYKGESALSVARGFQSSGSQNVLLSLWNVNDYTTAAYMNYFYSHLKDGKSYAEATADAKMDYLKDPKIPNAKKSPYYWSAMVYYGTLNRKGNSNYLVYAIGICAMIGLFLFTTIKSERTSVRANTKWKTLRKFLQRRNTEL